MAVITGNGHARTDRGVPALIRAERPEVSVFSIGQVLEAVPGAPFDAVVVTSAPESRSADPCAALR